MPKNNLFIPVISIILEEMIASENLKGPILEFVTVGMHRLFDMHDFRSTIDLCWIRFHVRGAMRAFLV